MDRDGTFPEILVAARRGEERAWTAIYGRLAPAVLGYLRARGAPDPEDLLGEVFLQVVRDVGRFSGEERDFRSWVFAVAHHRLLDDARYRSRRHALVSLDDPAGDGGPSGDVEEEAIEGLTNVDIRRVLAGLSRDQRTVLTLRVFGDMTLAEVARIMGKRLGAVKQLQRRGLLAVRKALARDGYPLAGGRTPVSRGAANGMEEA